MGGEASAVDVVRRFYAAVAVWDLDAAGACFDEHAVWIRPGRSAIAGEHRGWQAIRDDFLSKLRPLSGGTFSVELIDVAEGAHTVVAVQHATAEHGGKKLDVTACQVMTIESGRIVAVRGHYSDQY